LQAPDGVEETDELLLWDEEMADVDPECLPKRLITDFSIYNGEVGSRPYKLRMHASAAVVCNQSSAALFACPETVAAEARMKGPAGCLAANMLVFASTSGQTVWHACASVHFITCMALR
jgi:hypothetical protein